MLFNLVLMLLAGGGLAWWLESRIDQSGRWASLAVIALCLTYLVSALLEIPPQQFSLVPAPDTPESWLFHQHVHWIPRFGIALEMAMDGLSLILVLLTSSPFIITGSTASTIMPRSRASSFRSSMLPDLSTPKRHSVPATIPTAPVERTIISLVKSSGDMEAS